MPTDWFRRTHWTPEIETDFHIRLARARPANRAQYLRIQALHLQEAGGVAGLRKALELLDLMLAKYPDRNQLAEAHHGRAKCLIELSEFDAAVGALRAAFAAQRSIPNVRGPAYLTFGLLVTRHRRKALYDEALAILEEFGGNELFPREQYEAAAIRALVLDAKGAHREAAVAAQRALDASGKTDTGFRYHPHLALVVNPDPHIHKELERIAKR
jgi:tetratricopeptide (TPR) repeat protein